VFWEYLARHGPLGFDLIENATADMFERILSTIFNQVFTIDQSIEVVNVVIAAGNFIRVIVAEDKMDIYEISLDAIEGETGLGPTASFSVTPRNGVAPMQVSFTDLSMPGDAPIVTWSWNFDDGHGTTANNPEHIYAQPGIYSPSLTVTNRYGESEQQRISYITVNGE